MGRISIRAILVIIGIIYLVVAAVLITVDFYRVAPVAASNVMVSRLRIPAIGVDAFVQTAGLTLNGAMGIPTNYHDVAWFNGSVKPGAQGNAIVVGHRDTKLFAPGVFRDLKNLVKGDDVYFTQEDGRALRFRVVDTKIYYEDTDRLAEIVGPTDRTRLNLITCDGVWNQLVKRYDQRLVIFTELAS